VAFAAAEGCRWANQNVATDLICPCRTGEGAGRCQCRRGGVLIRLLCMYMFLDMSGVDGVIAELRRVVRPVRQSATGLDSPEPAMVAIRLTSATRHARLRIGQPGRYLAEMTVDDPPLRRDGRRSILNGRRGQRISSSGPFGRNLRHGQQRLYAGSVRSAHAWCGLALAARCLPLQGPPASPPKRCDHRLGYGELVQGPLARRAWTMSRS
jgi:hypothetical protein